MFPHDGGGAGATVEQGELSEVVARAEGRDLAVAALDGGSAFDDHEELVPGLVLLDENALLVDAHLV